ncbi:hypothetical protein F5050DRAFT_1742540 [Lentinula boryana]|uniref:Secreted protein n=1 Tax=Lentinula boryana TaxID=40481 RepID=A0ABQ8QJR9_9AGAR|nr:hypothetical protein F5050DRAFT_1742540 [Lentinula boryana]
MMMMMMMIRTHRFPIPLFPFLVDVYATGAVRIPSDFVVQCDTSVRKTFPQCMKLPFLARHQSEDSLKSYRENQA